MLWFVHPYNPNKAINLVNVASLACKKNMIYIDDHTWMFETELKAKETFESMIRVGQESRYRKRN